MENDDATRDRTVEIVGWMLLVGNGIAVDLPVKFYGIEFALSIDIRTYAIEGRKACSWAIHRRQKAQ